MNTRLLKRIEGNILKCKKLYNDNNVNSSYRNTISYITHNSYIPLNVIHVLLYDKDERDRYIREKFTISRNQDALNILILFKDIVTTRINKYDLSDIKNYMYDLEFTGGIAGHLIIKEKAKRSEYIKAIENIIYQKQYNINENLYGYLLRTINIAINNEIELRNNINEYLPEELHFTTIIKNAGVVKEEWVTK